jgi:hypothetical protein
MKQFFKILLFVVLTPAFSISEDGLVAGYRIIPSNNFDAHNLLPSENEEWYGIVKTTNGHYLKIYHPSVKVNSLTNHATVILNDTLIPLFLFQSPNEIDTGLVDTYYSGYDVLAPGEQLALKNGEYLLQTSGDKETPASKQQSEYFVNYTATLACVKNNNHSQVIAEKGRTFPESFFKLQWAGDVDRDGKIDLFIDLSWGEVAGHYALFLSSEAEDMDLVKLVAQLLIMGC